MLEKATAAVDGLWPLRSTFSWHAPRADHACAGEVARPLATALAAHATCCCRPACGHTA